MKCAIFAYLPPDKEPWHPREFLKNIGKNQPKNKAFFYSDQDWGTSWPNFRPTTSVDNKSATNVVSTNNTVFLHGVRIACREGIDWMLYLESDCRVKGQHWDDIIFSEFFDSKDYASPGFVPNQELDMGGSIVLFRSKNKCWFHDGAQRYILPKSKPMSRYTPSFGCPDSEGSISDTNCVFPNGALGVYRVSTLSDIWGVGPDTTDEQIKSTASRRKAWDWHHGDILLRSYQQRVFEHIKQIRCIYSSAGNVRTTEKERQFMLMSGLVVAIHQVKSAWTI